MSKSPYEKKEWYVLRSLVLERDAHKCRGCQIDDGHLHVHHIAYISGKEIIDIHSDLLVTLCECCHKKAHQKTMRRWYKTEEEALENIRRSCKIPVGEDLRDSETFREFKRHREKCLEAERKRLERREREKNNTEYSTLEFVVGPFAVGPFVAAAPSETSVAPSAASAASPPALSP